ncbi:MAG: hypothetical protein EOR86_17740 [Mesorhizobium sp.]|uniref:hypothetical protein n=1 Tax=Mesorhizobium sp. TaxID=1871066 RepID=UPI000FE4B831|nr:hypothetical protein [Mesorhizobium sp.]RWM94031.1 MAG: hypothetical protein EOR86_17740 [Mesorhizobium sp.]
MKTIKQLPQMMEFFLGKLEEDRDTHWVTTSAANVMDTMRWRLKEGKSFEIETSVEVYLRDLASPEESDWEPMGVVRYNWGFSEFYFRVAGFLLSNGRKFLAVSDVLTLILVDLELIELITIENHDGSTMVKSSKDFNKKFDTRIDVTIA